MAYPPQRPLRAELLEGMTDGSYKKAIQQRGGFVEPDTYEENRADLSDTWFGIHEEVVKTSPTGGEGVTPNTTITRPVKYPGS
jgi:hypothetical protein